MTRNTYKLATNCSLQSSKLPVVAGDIILKNRFGSYFPLKAKSPIIITDAAQNPTGYTMSGSGLDCCTDIFFDGPVAYTIRAGAIVRIDLSSAATRQAAMTVNYSYQQPCGAIAKVSNSIGVYCYKTNATTVLAQAFDLATLAAVGPSRNIAVSAANAIDVIACKFGGNDALAVLWQPNGTYGTFNVSVYLVTGAGIAATAAATVTNVITGGDQTYAKLFKSADGNKLIALSGSLAGVVNAGTGVAIASNINIGFSVLQSLGCTYLQGSNGLYLYQAANASTAIVIKTLWFDGTLTTTNSTAGMVTGTVGKLAAPVLYNNNYYLVVSCAWSGSVVDVFDQNMAFVSRSAISPNTMTGRLDVVNAVMGDNGLLYLITASTDWTDNRMYREVIDLNVPKPTSVIGNQIGVIAPVLAMPGDAQRVIFQGGVVHFFPASSVRVEAPQIAHSPQGIALTSSGAGTSFVMAETGDVNSPVQQVIDGVGTYNALTGVTPAGKRVTIFNGGKVRLENV